MSVGNVSSTENPYSTLGIALNSSADNKRTELGQDAFLKLMTAQLQHQDPTKPMESSAFLGQIAQFSTVSGIQGMQASLSGLSTALTSNQTLQAAGLVGHGVMVEGDSAHLFADGGISGTAALTASGSLAVEVTDTSGQVVRHIDLGTKPVGDASFTWDGLDDAGNRMAEGAYGIKASVMNGSGTTAVSTQLMGVVNSVSLGSAGLSLNLYGMNPVALSAVREIL